MHNLRMQSTKSCTCKTDSAQPKASEKYVRSFANKNKITKHTLEGAWNISNFCYTNEKLIFKREHKSAGIKLAIKYGEFYFSVFTFKLQNYIFCIKVGTQSNTVY